MSSLSNHFYLIKALSLVEDETRRYKSTKNYLEQLGQPIYHAFEVR